MWWPFLKASHLDICTCKFSFEVEYPFCAVRSEQGRICFWPASSKSCLASGRAPCVRRRARCSVGKKTVFVRSAEENQVSQQWGKQSKIRRTDLTEWVSSPAILPRCARRGPWSPEKNQVVTPGPGSRSDFEVGASGLAVGDARFFFAQAAPAWPN